MELTGAQIVIECLKEQKVDTVFGYPGGAILNVYDELYKHSDEIHHVLTSHEQGASHAADGYARSTGKVGVCLATSGPGATNLVTGIATAQMDSVPIVALTCNVGVSLLGKDSFQEVDIAGITMPITKHNFIVKDVTKLADTMRRAFMIAKTGRPGPVLVDIPKDVTIHEIAPKRNLGGILEFDSERTKKNMELGYFDGLRFLYGLCGRKYYLDMPYSEAYYFGRIMSELDMFKEWLRPYVKEEDFAKLNGYRVYTEKIFPFLAKKLRLRPEWDYRDLYGAVLEVFAKKMQLEAFRVYTPDEIVGKLQEILSGRPDYAADKRRYEENAEIWRKTIREGK